MQHNFSLQSVLDYRGVVVDSLEMELAQLMREKRQVESAIHECDAQEQRLWQELINGRLGELDLVRDDHLQNHLEMIEKEKEALVRALKSLLNHIHSKRQEIVEAKQDEEVLEIIKDKEIERFNHKRKLEDQKIQDDVYIARAYHTMAAQGAK